MNSPMSAHHQSVQDRYHQLRRELTDLNYPETFGVDALDLIDHLLRDMLSTTSSYKQLQDKENRLSSDLALVQAQLFPLRRENARLTRENHELHIDHIRQNEESSMQIDNYSRQVREATDKMQELKMLTAVYETQMKNKDEIIERLREAYEGVVDPALKAKHSTTSSIKSSGKLTKTDKSEAASGNRSFISGNNSVVGGMSIGGASRASVKSRASARNDLLHHPIVESQQEQVISALRGQLESASTKLQHAEDEMKHLKSAIAAREQELSRSNRIIGNAAARSILSGDGNAVGGSSSGLQAVMGSPIDPQVIDSSNKRIIDQLNSQVDFLNEQLAYREAQLTTLQGQIHESEHLKTELEVSVTTLERFKEENQRMSNRMHLLEQKLMAMGASLNTPRKTPNSQMAREHEHHAQDHFAEASVETKDIAGSPQRYSRQQESHGNNESSNVVYEDIIKKLKLEKSHLEKELQVAQSKVPATPPPPPAASTKSGSSKPTPKTTRDTTLITELNQEVELLRKKNTMFQKQIKEYEAKISYLQSMVSNGNGSGSKSNTTNHGFHEEVKEDELRAIRSQLDAKEGILQEVSYQRDRLQTLFDSCNDTLQVLQGEYQSLQQQYDAVQESQQYTAETMQQLQQEVRIRQQQCQQMEEECRQLKLQVATLQQQQQQQQSSRPLPQVPSVAASESTTTTTAAASSNALVKLRLHEERIQQLQHENQVLQSTITQLQSDQLLTKERYSTQQIAVNDESHRIVALEDLIVTYKHQIETLQHTQNNLQQEVVTYLKDKDSLERKISLQSHQLDDEVNKRKLAETQCIQIQTQMETLSFQHHQVKDMISRYEVKYQHQQEQLQQYEHVMERLQIDKQHWHDEKDLLETRLHEQEDKINQLKQVLQEVDTQRDELQDQVESLEDQVKMKSMETKHYHEQQMEYQQMITSQEKTIQSKQHEITQLMKFSQEMDGKLHVLLEEKQTLQRQCHDKLRKEGVMSEDLMLMTKENQALSSELSRLCHERDSFLQQLREHMTQLQLMESNKHSLEIEKHDLLENYRVVVKEKRKMEDEVRLLSSNQSERNTHLKQLEREVMELQAKLQSYQHLEERWAIEKSALTNHIEMLNDSVIDMQRKVEAMESDNRKMIQETHGMKQTNALLNERLSIVMKRAAASNEANKVLTTRLSTVERERDAVRAIVEVERQRAQDMMKVAEVARIDAATKDLHIQRLRTELHEESGDSLSPNVSAVRETSISSPK